MLKPASRVSLAVVAGLAGCAAAQEPPGGPPDVTPPAIVSTKPDSGAIVPQWHDAAVIEFGEVIDERSGGGLEKLITVSPVPKALDVDWKRSAIAIKPKGGWIEGVVYQVTLQPGVQDLRNNRLQSGKTIVFSTGGAIPATQISGIVVDWEQGRLAARALIQAIRLPDSLTYIGLADSNARFAIGAMPPGSYTVMAGVDGNNNRRLEPRESWDSATVTLDSVVEHTFWAFRHDTLGPQLTRVTAMDSMTLRLEFSQALPPEPPAEGAVTVRALPDSVRLEIAAIWRQPDYDTLPRSAGRTLDSAQVDTTQAGAGRPPAAQAQPTPPLPSRRAATDTLERAATDTSSAGRLLRQRPKLSPALVVRLVAPLSPGGRYVVEADVRNLTGARSTPRTLLVVPPRPAPPRP